MQVSHISKYLGYSVGILVGREHSVIHHKFKELLAPKLQVLKTYSRYVVYQKISPKILKKNTE